MNRCVLSIQIYVLFGRNSTQIRSLSTTNVEVSLMGTHQLGAQYSEI